MNVFRKVLVGYFLVLIFVFLSGILPQTGEVFVRLGIVSLIVGWAGFYACVKQTGW